MDIKREILNEIESRMYRLREYRDEEIKMTGNQYEELNQALSKVINVSLTKELHDLHDYITEL